MGEIHFFIEDVDFEIAHSSNLASWIERVVESHQRNLIVVNYIICSDKYLLDINRTYLSHDYLTDIITFDNSEEPKSIEADIFISLDRVIENANTLDVNLSQELHRVMIHGILHLLGWGDKTEAEKKVMREKEEACLSLLDI